MHCRPGQTKPVSFPSRSPSTASLVRTAPFRSRRSANVRVNLSGMCCATTIPARLVDGILAKISRSALGPPVELAIATTCFGAMYAVAARIDVESGYDVRLPSGDHELIGVLRETGAAGM